MNWKKIKIEKEGKNKDLLSLFNRVRLEADKLINEQCNTDNNQNIIIDTLNSRVNKLDLEILNLEEFCWSWRNKNQWQ